MCIYIYRVYTQAVKSCKNCSSDPEYISMYFQKKVFQSQSISINMCGLHGPKNPNYHEYARQNQDINMILICITPSTLCLFLTRQPLTNSELTS